MKKERNVLGAERLSEVSLRGNISEAIIFLTPECEVPMLPPFIIEQIRQREEQRKRDDRPRLELPLDDLRSWMPNREPSPPSESEGQRGVIIIDI